MKVKDTAMGAWFRSLVKSDGEDAAVGYILGCLMRTRDGIFWDIIEYYDLKAKTSEELAEMVSKRLMDFELDPDERQDPDGFDHIPELTEEQIEDLAKRQGEEQ